VGARSLFFAARQSLQNERIGGAAAFLFLKNEKTPKFYAFLASRTLKFHSL